jgi:purine-nucleoside phosphorylase
MTLVDGVADRLRERLDGFRPKMLLTLGSGLGGLADDVASPTVVPFGEVGLPDTTVPGHAGRFVAGHLKGVPVLCQQGRVHLYEGRDIDEVVAAVGVAARLGAEVFVPTNAAGGIGDGGSGDLAPGDLMLITDHLNLTGHNPLVGRPRPHFLDLKDAYDPQLRALAREAAESVGERLREGVYAGLVGPSFETPAEIVWLRTIGARAVGMSTVSEVIAARDLGLRVVAFSLITNVHLPGGSHTDHEEVMDVGGQAGPRLAALLRELLPRVP